MSKNGDRFRNNHNRDLGYSEKKFERQMDGLPTLNQMEFYKDLVEQCVENGVNIELKKPNTRQEYSDSIAKLKEALQKKKRKTTREEEKLLSLFNTMNSAQKTRLLAYAEGLLGKTKSEKKA